MNRLHIDMIQNISSVQSLSCVRLFAIPWTAARQASLSITNSQSLLKLMSIEWCHPIISSSVIPFSSHLQSFPAPESFLVSQFFVSGGQKYWSFRFRISPPMNIQGWFSLGLTGLTSLLSKGLSSLLQFESINSLAFCLSYCPVLTSIHDYWKDYSFD